MNEEILAGVGMHPLRHPDLPLPIIIFFYRNQLLGPQQLFGHEERLES